VYTYSPRSNPPAFIRKKADQPFSGYGDVSHGNFPGNPNTSRNDAFNPSVIPLDPTRAWLYRSITSNLPGAQHLTTTTALEQRLLALYDQAKAETAKLRIEDIRAALGKPADTTNPDPNAEAKDRLRYVFSSALPEQLRIKPSNPQEIAYYQQFASQILKLATELKPRRNMIPFNRPTSIRSKL